MKTKIDRAKEAYIPLSTSKGLTNNDSIAANAIEYYQMIGSL